MPTTTISLDALRELTAFRAERGCAITLYLDLDPSTSPTAGDVATRVRSLLSKARQQDAPRRDVERVQRFFESEFERDGARGYAVFVADADGAWHDLPLVASVPDSIHVGDEFHVAPLVPLLGDGAGALVAFVGRERGSLYHLRQGRLAQLADLSDHVPRRHDQGGWAQARLQRHVDEVAAQHYREVADALDRRFRALGRPRVVLIATEETRAELDDILSADLADAVIGWGAAEAHATAARLEAVVEPIFHRWRAECERKHVDRWREEAGRGAKAATGWAETLEAASDGRVELLLHRDAGAHEVVRCPRCGRVQAEGETCPLDGAELERRPDGFELLVRQVLAHGGSVWTLRDAQDLDPVGGIGALLRF
jgi:peptide chain release factor subunit 1